MPLSRYYFPARLASPGHSNAQKLSVVILYEHLTYVGRAVATYLHLMRDLAGDYDADFRLWHIERALEPAQTAEAESDIAAAEVIIMAVNGSQQCPPAFLRWKDGAGHGGGRPPHAIIALMEASNELAPSAESWSHVLRGAGTQIHPEVFDCDSTADGPGGIRTALASGLVHAS